MASLSVRHVPGEIIAASACQSLRWDTFDPYIDSSCVYSVMATATLVRKQAKPAVVVRGKIAQMQPRDSTNPAVRLVGRGVYRSTKEPIIMDLDEFQK